MDQVRITGVVQDIRRGLQSGGGTIDEMTYLDLFDVTAEAIAQLPTRCSQVEDLLQDIGAAYTYGDFDKLEGFAVGACWGSLKTFDACREAKRSTERANAALDVMREHYGLFAEMGEHPGITQGELAQALSKTKSAMSQLLSRLAVYSLFSVSIAGRSKHYYLTRLGERALDEVEGERAPELAGIPAAGNSTGNGRPMAAYQAGVYQVGFIDENSNALPISTERFVNVQLFKGDDDVTKRLNGTSELLLWQDGNGITVRPDFRESNRPELVKE